MELEQLPSIDKFCSKLNDEHITNEDYNHAIQVWNHFNIKNLGEYSDLYFKIDVLLLCDCFENFRSLCLTSYNLDCAYYLTVPGFAFDAMLNFTKIELELFDTYDMHLFLEKTYAVELVNV